MDQYAKLQLLEENICDFRLGKKKLRYDAKHTIHKRKNVLNWTSSKIKNYLYSSKIMNPKSLNRMNSLVNPLSNNIEWTMDIHNNINESNTLS